MGPKISNSKPPQRHFPRISSGATASCFDMGTSVPKHPPPPTQPPTRRESLGSATGLKRRSTAEKKAPPPGAPEVWIDQAILGGTKTQITYDPTPGKSHTLRDHSSRRVIHFELDRMRGGLEADTFRPLNVYIAVDEIIDQHAP